MPDSPPEPNAASDAPDAPDAASDAPDPARDPAPPPRSPPEISEDLLDSDAVKVVRRLRRSGFAAYLVGGCVRDLLLGRRPKDFDVATSARPEEVRSQIGRAHV